MMSFEIGVINLSFFSAPPSSFGCTSREGSDLTDPNYIIHLLHFLFQGKQTKE